MSKITCLLIAGICLAGFSTAAAGLPTAEGAKGEKLKEARCVIGLLQPEIREKISYTDEELSKLKEEFQEHYHERVEPKFDTLAERIDRRAIHWVDVDDDPEEELVFWTAGIVQWYWGPKRHLFVIDINSEGKAAIVASEYLDSPSMEGDGIYGKIWLYPNRGRGHNDFVRAVFASFYIGCSGSTHTYYTIGWNRYPFNPETDTYGRVYINHFSTSFPIDIAPLPKKGEPGYYGD